MPCIARVAYAAPKVGAGGAQFGGANRFEEGAAAQTGPAPGAGGAAHPKSCTVAARCCACELMPASRHARPVCSYSRRSATRALSSATSAAHLASPASTAFAAEASRRRSSICAAFACSPRSAAAFAAAMSSAASTRNRSRATSTHVDEQQEAPLLVGVQLSDVHGCGSAIRVDAAVRRMTLATAFLCRRPWSTSAATRRPSPMLVVPSAKRDSTALLANALPPSVMRESRMMRWAVHEKVTMLSRSPGPRWSMTKPMACFRSPSLGPSMLPLTSSTVTRSSGARSDSDASAAAATGALACSSTAKFSLAASLATAGCS
nr:unnamed protein product [Digitaria exilis]